VELLEGAVRKVGTPIESFWLTTVVGIRFRSPCRGLSLFLFPPRVVVIYAPGGRQSRQRPYFSPTPPRGRFSKFARRFYGALGFCRLGSPNTHDTTCHSIEGNRVFSKGGFTVDAATQNELLAVGQVRKQQKQPQQQSRRARKKTEGARKKKT